METRLEMESKTAVLQGIRFWNVSFGIAIACLDELIDVEGVILSRIVARKVGARHIGDRVLIHSHRIAPVELFLARSRHAQCVASHTGLCYCCPSKFLEVVKARMLRAAEKFHRPKTAPKHRRRRRFPSRPKQTIANSTSTTVSPIWHC